MKDISLELLEKIRKDFTSRVTNSQRIKTLYKMIEDGSATYAEAEEYALLVGDALSQAFGNYLSSDILPDGKMYYNIADRVLRPLIEEDYSLISDAAVKVQAALNKKANLGIKVQTAALDTERVNSIINSVADADVFDDISWLLDEPLKNLFLSFVTNTLKENVEFQGKAGLKAQIIRKHEAKACKWCLGLAGTYSYPDLPRDVYRRHQRCRCTVLYDPGNGRMENVHTHKAVTSQEEAEVEARQFIGLKVNGTTVKKASGHALDQLASRNITVDRVKDTISSPLKVKTVSDKQGQRMMVVIGKKATLRIDPDTGEILTAYPTHKQTARQYRKRKEAKK